MLNSTRKLSRLSTLNTVDVESTLDLAWKNKRAPASFAGLVKAMTRTFKSMPSDVQEFIGFDLYADPEGPTKFARFMSENNMFMAFQGRTPHNEERKFIVGNPEDDIWGIVLITGVLEFDGDFTNPDVKLYAFVPNQSNSFGPGNEWQIQELPKVLIELLMRQKDYEDALKSTVTVEPQEQPDQISETDNKDDSSEITDELDQK